MLDTHDNLRKQLELHQKARRERPELRLWWLVALNLIAALCVAVLLRWAPGASLFGTGLLFVLAVTIRELRAYRRKTRRAAARLKQAHEEFRADRKERERPKALPAAKHVLTLFPDPTTEALPVQPRLLTPPRPVPPPSIARRPQPIQWSPPPPGRPAYPAPRGKRP